MSRGSASPQVRSVSKVRANTPRPDPESANCTQCLQSISTKVEASNSNPETIFRVRMLIERPVAAASKRSGLVSAERLPLCKSNGHARKTYSGVCVCAESRVHLFSFYKSYKRKKKERRQLYKSIKPAPARGQGQSISTNYCFVPGRFRHAAWQTDSTQNAQNRRQMWPHNAVGLMSLAFCSKEASTGRVITLNRLTTLTDRGPQKKKKACVTVTAVETERTHTRHFCPM